MSLPALFSSTKLTKLRRRCWVSASSCDDPSLSPEERTNICLVIDHWLYYFNLVPTLHFLLLRGNTMNSKCVLLLSFSGLLLYKDNYSKSSLMEMSDMSQSSWIFRLLSPRSPCQSPSPIIPFALRTVPFFQSLSLDMWDSVISSSSIMFSLSSLSKGNSVLINRDGERGSVATASL